MSTPVRSGTRITLALAMAGALAMGSCSFAQKHPAVTIGLVAGTIGFSTCFLAVEKVGTCGLVGAGAGVAIGGITGLATTVFHTNAPPPDPDTIQLQKGDGPPPGPYLPPEPNPLPLTAVPDAGVPMTMDAGVAPVDATSADAPAAP